MDPALFDLNSEIETSHWWFVARREIMRAVVESVLPAGRGHKIIDFGCGTGANIASLADAYECIGIDSSQEALQHARERFPNVTYLEGRSPEDLGGIVDGTDGYLLMDVLEHVENDDRLLKKLADSLEPGGYLLITVPADKRLWSQHDVSHGHYRRYNIGSLRALWRDLPLSEHLVSYFNSRLYPAARIVRALNRKRGGTAGEGGSDLRLPSKPLNSLLRSVFAGEARRLVRTARRPGKRAYRRGVSLIALLRRDSVS